MLAAAVRVCISTWCDRPVIRIWSGCVVPVGLPYAAYNRTCCYLTTICITQPVKNTTQHFLFITELNPRLMSRCWCWSGRIPDGSHLPSQPWYHWNMHRLHYRKLFITRTCASVPTPQTEYRFYLICPCNSSYMRSILIGSVRILVILSGELSM